MQGLPTAPAPAPAPAAEPQPAALDLQQTVQAALQDLLSGVGLEHEDSWEAPGAPVPLAPASLQSSRRATAGGGACVALPATTARSSVGPSTSLAPGRPAPAAAAALGAAPSLGDDDEPLQEGDLPPAAAARLYAARLRAAQSDLEGLQAAVRARDAKLGAVEKEVQQLR